jgi:hypothetical protein
MWLWSPESKYEISNYGRIRYQNKIYNESTDQNGYRYFGIYNFDGDKIIDYKRIHWEVAKAFLPNINNQQIVNHRDGNRDNNNLDNLYYFSIAEEDKQKLLYNKSSSGYRGIQYIPNKMGAKYRIVITEKYLKILKNPPSLLKTSSSVLYFRS